ncbi:MAG: DoxX family protein [Pseudomonadota bacterium]
MKTTVGAGRGERNAQFAAGALTLGTVGIAVVEIFGIGTLLPAAIHVQAAAFLLLFLSLSSLVAFILTRRHATAAFLIGVFTVLVGWRIVALADLTLTMIACGATFLAYCLAFVGHARSALLAGHASGATVHLTFFRLYLGLDLVPHFSEKLFAGPVPRNEDVAAFESLGVPFPLAFVLVAGLVECAAAIGVGLGLLTRLAAPATVTYLMIATVMGGHFSLGFIWASPGGGWEYPLLWSVLILTFLFGGGRWLSLDAELARLRIVPRWAKPLLARAI